MNTKNLTLGFVASVFAIGSAFTTREKVINFSYVWWKEAPYSPGFVCKDLPGNCATSGSLLCKAVIVVESGAVKTPAVHNAANCLNTYNNDDNGRLGELIDLEGAGRPFSVSDDGATPL
jgi:hypothetical protein